MTRLLKILISSIVIGVCIYAYLYFAETNAFSFALKNWKWVLVVSCLASVSGLSITWANGWLSSKMSWHEHAEWRFASGLIMGNLILFLIQAGTYKLAISASIIKGSKLFGLMVDYDLIVKLLLLNFIVILVYLISNLMRYSYHHFVHGQIEKVKLSRRQYELQFEALKNQLSPHYLFNSFNTISSLTYIDKSKAEQFIRKLVQTYQYILSTKEKKLITVNQELDFIRSYNYLLKVRYEDALQLKIDLSDAVLLTMIPPLTLQILLENAVKHNTISNDCPLLIRIHEDKGGLLTVTNSTNEKSIKETSFHIGLENIKKRYQFFTHNSINVIAGDQFHVQLPILIPDH